jgi:VanZ family protein
MNARTLFRLAGWFCIVVIAGLSIGSPSLRPVTFLLHELEHAAIFAMTAFALGLGYPHRAAQHVVSLTIFAGVVELAQIYAPGRHARLEDFVVDILAACAGIALSSAILSFRKPVL